MAGERSPNYPIISLAEALPRIQAVYDKERTHAADADVVARDLGYGSLNGASRGIISALRKFGLLAEEGEQVKVSNDALDILLHSRGRPERTSALERAAFTPALFSELRGQFGRSLPSDENMRAYLIKRGFNPNTVTNVIRSYRDTVELVNFETRQGEPEEAPSDEATPAVAGVGPITMIPHALVPQQAETELAFQLTPGCHVRLGFTGEVTREAFDKLRAFLDLSRDIFPTGAPTHLEDVAPMEAAGQA